MRRPEWWAGVVFVALAAMVGPANAQSRGELLYTTHCAACHNEQMHWRQFRLATDWPSLKDQVRRWQANAKLQWNDEDVDAVAGYLNDSIYRYVRTDVRTSALMLTR